MFTCPREASCSVLRARICWPALSPSAQVGFSTSSESSYCKRKEDAESHMAFLLKQPQGTSREVDRSPITPMRTPGAPGGEFGGTGPRKAYSDFFFVRRLGFPAPGSRSPDFQISSPKALDFKISKSGTLGLEIWKSGNLEIWKSRALGLEIWKSRALGLEIWKSRALGLEIWKS